MRLLVIGHTYVLASNQQKYATMKRLNPSLELRVVSPLVVQDAYRVYAHEVAAGLSAEEAIGMKSFFERSHMTFLFEPFTLIKLLRTFKPDLIHIEEDPHSLVAIETIFFASLFCRQAQISFFIWDNLHTTPRFPLNWIKKVLTCYSLRHAAMVVTGNQEAQALLLDQKHYKGFSTVLPQFGIELGIYGKEAKPEITRVVAKSRGVPLIGFMGRLVPEKGILILCEALNGLKDIPWKFVIVGAGPLESVLREKWKPIFGDRMNLLGAGARAELPDYLKLLDVLVVPSVSTPVWKEQFGYIIVEAMASGVPVIGSSAGAIPEVIGDAGLIFPEGDVSQLKVALTQLLYSEADRAKYSRLGRDWARQNYAHEVVSQAYMKLFEAIPTDS